MRRFLRPIFRRPFPDRFVPTQVSQIKGLHKDSLERAAHDTQTSLSYWLRQGNTAGQRLADFVSKIRCGGTDTHEKHHIRPPVEGASLIGFAESADRFLGGDDAPRIAATKRGQRLGGGRAGASA